MNITIREARRNDLGKVAELFNLYRQFYEQVPDRNLALRFISERFEKGQSIIIVAEDGEADLVGFCQLYPTFCSVEAKPIYVLSDLFVIPSARKLGAGRGLLKAAEAKAANDGKSRMDLTTARTNLPAQRLYESLGWVRDEIFLAYNRRITNECAPETSTPPLNHGQPREGI